MLSATCEWTREAFADAWVGVVSGNSVVPLRSTELTACLLGLTERLTELVVAVTYDAAVVRGIGAELVHRRFTDPSMLGSTLSLLVSCMPELVGPGMDDRIAIVAGDIAAGYATALSDRARRGHGSAAPRAVTGHDSVTGSRNRGWFTQQLNAVFARAEPGRRVGLCYLDLDGFTTVNCTLGRDIGDELLAAVAARLADCCADDYLIARIGGDEFAVLLPDTNGVEQVIAVAQDVVRSVGTPLRVAGEDLTVTTSIGIVELPVAETSPTELTAAANVALNWAKSRGRNRYEVYDAARSEQENLRSVLASTMVAAIDRDEFVLEYQPLVMLTDGTLCGAEALVRWEHPTFGRVGPNTFIDLAEETGAIVALGRWVLQQACAQGAAWYREFGYRAPRVSVNLAPRQLQDPDLVADVVSILDEAGLPAHLLQLELTEQVVMNDDLAPTQALHKLSELGVGIVLDDFGTGYSNVSYLHRFPLDGLKLDASFVRELNRDDDPEPAVGVIVSTIIGLAHALDLTVTAEGVETAAQRDRLLDLGCDTGQGWLFARPGPAATITQYLREPPAAESPVTARR